MEMQYGFFIFNLVLLSNWKNPIKFKALSLKKSVKDQLFRFRSRKNEGQCINERRKSYNRRAVTFDISAENLKRNFCLKVWALEDHLRKIKERKSPEQKGAFRSIQGWKSKI